MIHLLGKNGSVYCSDYDQSVDLGCNIENFNNNNNDDKNNGDKCNNNDDYDIEDDENCDNNDNDDNKDNDDNNDNDDVVELVLPENKEIFYPVIRNSQNSSQSANKISRR